MASSREDPRILYIVNGDKILVYHFSTLTPSGMPTLSNWLSDPRCTNDHVNDRTINVMKIGYLGTEEVLVTADETGDVCVWFTMNLRRDPLLLSVGKSAWGIAIHSEQRLIAISCNAHTVTVFHCGIDSCWSQRVLSRDNSSTRTDNGAGAILTNVASLATSTPLPSFEPHIEHTSQQILRGHQHNIPSVTFSRCGNFLATASVDRTCRTWRLSDGQQIQHKSLGPLWGWGVCFVDKDDSWMTLSRQEYKQIPKDHLHPGKLPGQNVRDSPLSTTAFSQRRLPPGRDYRMVRSRWFAGPLHNTSCDELDSDDEDPRRSRGDADGADEIDYMDDRDAALFGMDDDEGEDEWEDTSTDGGEGHERDVEEQEEEEVGETMDEGDDLENEFGRRGLEAILQPIQHSDVSADTGDDADIEGTGIDTEDGGGTTTEDGAGTRSSTVLAQRSHRTDVRRPSVAAAARSSIQQQGESSSEHEVLKASMSSARTTESNIAIMDKIDDNASGGRGDHLDQSLPQEVIEAREWAINVDPNAFTAYICTQQISEGSLSSQLRNHRNRRLGIGTKATAASELIAAQRSVPPSTSNLLSMPSPSLSHSTLTLPPLPASSQPQPSLPSELLLCATARNIYLLSQDHPPPPNRRTKTYSSRLASARDSLESLQSDPPDEGLITHNELLMWHSNLFQDEDPDYDSDPYYDYTMDELMGTADDDSNSGDSESDDDNDDDDPYAHHHHHDNDVDMDDQDDEEEGVQEGGEGQIPALYTISVARAAVARADGRRFHFLEHFDRIFNILLIPELNVLIAASQKGAVTIFRLLKVLDDPSCSETLTAETATSAAGASSTTLPTGSTRKGSVAECSISSMEHKLTGDALTGAGVDNEARKRMKKKAAAEGEGMDHSNDDKSQHNSRDHDRDKEHEPKFKATNKPVERFVLFPEVYLPRLEPPPQPLFGVSVVPLCSPSSSSASASSVFLLHLAYIDTQFYSYEIRLRNEKDDTVALNNIFV
ncbi:hypothetical protein BX616_008357 [Lobosporangium transversale]|nr:hypothetical protein BX616_008357 [Lobosporangium transversale]